MSFAFYLIFRFPSFLFPLFVLVSVVVGGFLFSIPCFSAICLLKEACLTSFLFSFSAYCITVLYFFSFCFSLYMSANYLSCLYQSRIPLPSFAGPYPRIHTISFLSFHPIILTLSFRNYLLCDLVCVCYSWSLWSSVNKKVCLG